MKLKKILCTAVSTVMITSVCMVNAEAYNDTYDDGIDVTFYSTADIEAYMTKYPSWTPAKAEVIALSSETENGTFVVDKDIDFSGYDKQLNIRCDLSVDEGCTLNASDSTLFMSENNINLSNKGTIKCTNIYSYGATEGESSAIENNGEMYFKKFTTTNEFDQYAITYENHGNFEFINNGMIFFNGYNLISQNGSAGIMGTGTGTLLTTGGSVTYNKDFGDIYEHKDVPADSGIGLWQGKIGNLSSLLTEDNKSGDTDITMSGATISAPTYTVTIPKTVSFGTQNKTKQSNIVTTTATISASGVSNLFANQQKLVVTVESANDFEVSDSILDSSNIPYKFYTSYADKTELDTDKTVLTVVGTATADTNVSGTKSCTLALDTKDISKAGDFSDTMTFTIALESVGD